MAKVGSAIGSLVFAAALGTLAAAPERVPFLLTHDKVRARIETLDEKAVPFVKRMSVLEEEIRRPAEPKGPRSRSRAERASARAEKTKELDSLRQTAKDEVCSDPVVLGRGRKFEIPFDEGTYQLPTNLRTVCDYAAIRFDTLLLSPDGWRVVFGIIALLGLADATKEIFSKDKKKKEGAQKDETEKK